MPYLDPTRRVGAFLLLIPLLMQPATALGWGDQGHRIIGLIAQHYLTASVRRKIAALLARDAGGLADSTSIADETVWADRYRDSDRNGSQVHYRETQAWHYIDLEMDHPDIAAACPHRSCIVDKIEEFKRQLADASTPPAERLIALQFLLHLIGDLHQPLHAADQHDRGGNEVSVRSEGLRHGGNLHQYWDSVVVARLGSPSEAVADRLIAGISAAQRRAFRKGSVTAWAYESFGVARREVYATLPPPGADGARTLDAQYTERATATAALQLQRAGVRLAATLNDALR